MRKIHTADDTDDEQRDPLPDGTEHVVVLTGKGVIETSSSVARRTGDADAETVLWERGDELPRPLAERLWRGGQADVLAALDDAGERLDRPGRAEANGDLDADAALRKWRASNDLQRKVVTAYRCDVPGCDAGPFESKSALSGHQSAHTGGGRPANGEAAVETMKDRLAEQGDGDAEADPEADGDTEGERDESAAETMTDGGAPEDDESPIEVLERTDPDDVPGLSGDDGDGEVGR